MNNKKLLKSINVISDVVNDKETNSYDLNYFMLETDDDQNSKVYGVSICKTVNGLVVEETVEKYLCNTESQAEDFINLLVEGSVTPFGLEDIISEKEKES